MTRQYSVPTSHGKIMVEEHGESDIPLVLIHGNSSSRKVFQHQIQSDFFKDVRVITFDLPGHGESDKAPVPAQTYTRVGLANAVSELFQTMDMKEAVVFGWSLGGHIAIEMMPNFSGMRGLAISGAPPVSPQNMAHGFKKVPTMGAAAKEELSDAEIDSFVQTIFGQSALPFLRDLVANTDGRFRKILFEAARAGTGSDARIAVEETDIPIAVINGAEDPIINLDYFDEISFRNLWKNKCHRLTGSGHAPFWEAPDLFNPLLQDFYRDAISDKTS